jgi:hypothetical protein
VNPKNSFQLFRLFFVAAVGLAAQVSQAVIPEVSCTPSGEILVVYANGIRNEPAEAAINLNALARTIGTQPRRGHALSYRLIYNPTQGFLSDALETVRVKAAEYGGLTEAQILAGYDSALIYKDLGDALGANRILRFAEDVAGYWSRKIAAFRDLPIVNEQDFINAVAAAKSLPTTTSVLLVGHSEGSVFANLLFDAITNGPNARSAESIRVTSVGVAAKEIKGLLPSEVTPPQRAYVTSSRDVVMNLTRALRPDTLEGYVDSPPLDEPIELYLSGELDILNHNMVKVYLNPRYPLLLDKFKANVDLALERMSIRVDASACNARFTFTGSYPSWNLPVVSEFRNIVLANRSQFWLLGTPGNTCGGERGGPLYSLDTRIPIGVEFYVPGLVLNPPAGPVGINRRPCSSFVAIKLVPDPSGIRLPRYRVWANVTGRGQQFIGTNVTDIEYQTRFDSGDPFTGADYQCISGFATASIGNFVPTFPPATCAVAIVPK